MMRNKQTDRLQPRTCDPFLSINSYELRGWVSGGYTLVLYFFYVLQINWHVWRSGGQKVWIVRSSFWQAFLLFKSQHHHHHRQQLCLSSIVRHYIRSSILRIWNKWGHFWYPKIFIIYWKSYSWSRCKVKLCMHLNISS